MLDKQLSDSYQEANEGETVLGQRPPFIYS